VFFCGFFAKWFFGGLGYQGQKTARFQEKTGLLALPPKAARPINQSSPENMWFFGLGTPGLQKKHLANKPLWDPSE
jgi:hypothetical protein